MFTYQYDNDTGYHDEYFSEFWTILDSYGNKVGRMNDENMAALVVDLLNKNTGWHANKVQCSICSHGWIAVYRSSCDKLECPNCNNMTSFELIK